MNRFYLDVKTGPKWGRGASAKGRDYFDHNYYYECFVVFLLFYVGHTIISCNFVPASPDQGHDRPCRRDVGKVFLADARLDSP